MSAFSWLVLVLLAAIAGLGSLRFRWGHGGPLRKLYENEGAPQLLRNLPLVVPWALVLWVPLLILASPGVELLGLVSDVPRRVLGWMIFVGLGYLMVTLAIIAAAVLSPPRWMLPKWISHSTDRADLRVRGFDRLVTALVAVGLAIAGAWTLTWSIGSLLRT